MRVYRWRRERAIFQEVGKATQVLDRRRLAGVIQLVECQLPKLDVAGSSPVARSQYANDLHAVGITDSDGVVIL